MHITATRPFKRLLFTVLVFTTLAILSFLLEPRRRSLSCRNFWSCIKPYSGWTSKLDRIHPIPEEQEIAVTETTLSDRTVKFHRKLRPEVPSILFLVLTRDGHDWSRDFQSTQRSIYDFLDLLASTGLEPRGLSLGLLTQKKDEFELLKKATDEIPLGRVTVLLREGDGDVDWVGGSHDHSDGDRQRVSMAKQRNYLMSRVLLDEKHVFWVDAGTVEFSPRIVQKMISHADDRSDVGIITARCEKNEIDSYDTNAWAIAAESTLLGPANRLDQNNRQVMLEELQRAQQSIPRLIEGTSDGDLIPLHSVGSTMLYIRADLIRQGLVFPWWKVVGTSWTDDGWVGLDTEGLCYLSSRMTGGGCFVLGGTHKVRHTDWG